MTITRPPEVCTTSNQVVVHLMNAPLEPLWIACEMFNEESWVIGGYELKRTEFCFARMAGLYKLTEKEPE